MLRGYGTVVLNIPTIKTWDQAEQELISVQIKLIYGLRWMNYPLMLHVTYWIYYDTMFIFWVLSNMVK